MGEPKEGSLAADKTVGISVTNMSMNYDIVLLEEMVEKIKEQNDSLP